MGHSLTALAERIAQIEGRAACCTPDRIATGWSAIDAALGGGIARRGLHEWWGEPRDVGAVLVHLAWQAILHDDQHRPGAMRHVVWVGERVCPAPTALVRGLRAPLAGMFGGRMPCQWPDARLHDRSIIVDPAWTGGTAAAGVRLWAIEQAARCAGVCAVVADGAGFDLAATRRLQLAAHDVLLLVARMPQRHPPLSACSTRWRVHRLDGLPRAELLAQAAHASSAAGASAAATAAASASATATATTAAQPIDLADLRARLPAEAQWCVTLERAKGTHAVGASAGASAGAPASTPPDAQERALSAQAARHWEWSGTSEPPRAAVLSAARRAQKRLSRMAARAAQRRASTRTLEAPQPSRMEDDAAMHRTRGRGRGRCTSGGERWASQQDDRAA